MDGAKFRQIGHVLGVSVERAQQIVRAPMRPTVADPAITAAEAHVMRKNADALAALFPQRRVNP